MTITGKVSAYFVTGALLLEVLAVMVGVRGDGYSQSYPCTSSLYPPIALGLGLSGFGVAIAYCVVCILDKRWGWTVFAGGVILVALVAGLYAFGLTISNNLFCGWTF